MDSRQEFSTDSGPQSGAFGLFFQWKSFLVVSSLRAIFLNLQNYTFKVSIFGTSFFIHGKKRVHLI